MGPGNSTSQILRPEDAFSKRDPIGATNERHSCLPGIADTGARPRLEPPEMVICAGAAPLGALTKSTDPCIAGSPLGRTRCGIKRLLRMDAHLARHYAKQFRRLLGQYDLPLRKTISPPDLQAGLNARPTAQSLQIRTPLWSAGD
jgi:hypothetical protein